MKQPAIACMEMWLNMFGASIKSSFTGTGTTAEEMGFLKGAASIERVSTFVTSWTAGTVGTA